MNNTNIKRLVNRYNNRFDDKIKFIETKFKANPVRLLSAIGIRPAKQNTYCCINCTSGTGDKGTGLYTHLNEQGFRRYHCFGCGYSFRPIAGVIDRHPGMTFNEAVDFLVDLYTPEHDPVNDKDLPTFHNNRRSSLPCNPLQVDDQLLATYAESITYRQSCPQWQQNMADALGLPFEALSRPDIGKAFVGADGINPSAGDLVTYNLLQGIPQAIKVRHQPGIGHPGYVATIAHSCNVFRFTSNPCDQRTFRMAGSSGDICFGHDTITDATSIVIITEGQTDTLAVCAAASKCGRPDITAIGRDSATHILKKVDLDVLAGKTIVYCEDDDIAGRHRTQDNIDLLTAHNCSVSTWCASCLNSKDARDAFRNHGAHDLLTSILNTTHNHGK